MGFLVIDCPHCPATHVAMPILFVQARPGHRANIVGTALYSLKVSVGLLCRSCHNCVGAWLDSTNNKALSPFDDVSRLTTNDGDPLQYGWTLWNITPKRVALTAPEYVPKNVAEIYTQAEHARRAEHAHTAGTGFGKTLDVATKQLDATENLAARIRKLGKTGKLAPDLAEWAQDLRVIRNYNMHEEEPQTDEDTDDVGEATRLILIYLFTLPKTLEAVKARRNPPPDDGRRVAEAS